jgi:hypothetical protein
MPGVILPAQAAEKAQAEQDQLVKLAEELLALCRRGEVRWIAIAGEFDNGNKLSGFGNINKGDPLRVVGSIEWLKQDYMGAIKATLPVTTP